MNKELLSIVKNFEGTVLAIGIDEKVAEAIDKNDKIAKCDILNYIVSKKDYKKNKKEKTKVIDIKKVRKIYKKKNVDYIICEYEQMEKYLNTFVKDSVYINSSKLYFYGKLDEELILKKYKRYTKDIKVNNYKNGCIIEINNSNTKNNIFKEFIYKVIDGTNNVIEFIGDVMMG